MGFRRAVIISAFLLSFSIGALTPSNRPRAASTPSSRSRSRSGSPTSRPTSCRDARSTPKASASPAGYISDHLKEWGVKPAGDNGTYFQIVKVLGVRTTSRASVTVEVNGQTRTFKDGEGITFPRNMGGKQTIVARPGSVRRLRPAAPGGEHRRLREASIPKGKVVVYLGPSRSEDAPQSGVPAAQSPRAQPAAIEKGAIAVIGPPGGGGCGGRGGGGAGAGAATRRLGSDARHPRAAPRTAGRPGGRGRGGGRDDGDFTTVQRYDGTVTPARHRAGRVLRVPLQRLRREVRGPEGRRPRSRSRCRRSRSRASRSRSTSTPTTRRPHAASPATSSASSRAAIRS